MKGAGNSTRTRGGAALVLMVAWGRFDMIGMRRALNARLQSAAIGEP